MKIVSAFDLTAQETSFITLGSGILRGEVRPLKDSDPLSMVGLIFLPLVSFLLDCSGGAEGSSHTHLSLDPDWQHHRRPAATRAHYFHTVEGIYFKFCF